MRLTPSTLRSVAGLATAGLLAGGLMVHGASAATYTCPTFTDPAGDDTTMPKDPDIDLTAVTYTVSNGRFQAILKLAKLDTGTANAASDIFRTNFTVAEKPASFSVQRDQLPSEKFTISGSLGGKPVKTTADFDLKASTVTLSAAVADLETAAEVPLAGQAFSAMKASTTASDGGAPVPVGAGMDSAAAPAEAAYTFGDACGGQATPPIAPSDTPTDTPTDAPTDTPTDAPTDTPTDAPSGDPSATPTDSGSPTPSATTGTAGYVGLASPVRVLDTRGGSKRVGSVNGPVNGSFSFTLGSQVPAGATAVVLNVTATGSTTSGNLVVHRTGTANPGTSSLNWSAGANQANEVTSAIDSTKSIDVDIRSAGRTHVVIDLIGYVSSDSADASTLTLRTPSRLFDKTIEDGPTRITVPASLRPAGTRGALVNVTLVTPFAPAFLSVYPGNKTRTGTSTVNATSKEVQSNETLVALDANGTFIVDLNVGVARVVVDLLGTYGDATSTSGTITPREKPLRLLDTRTGLGGPKGKRQNGSDTPVKLPTADLPAGTVGVVLQVTTTQATQGGYAAVHPGGTSFNNTSTINLTKSSDRAHQVVVALGSGNPLITLGGNGATHLVADLIGYVVVPGSTDASPTPDPSASTDPSADPSASTDPSADPSASTDPSADPSASSTPTPTPSPTRRCTLPPAPAPCP